MSGFRLQNRSGTGLCGSHGGPLRREELWLSFKGICPYGLRRTRGLASKSRSVCTNCAKATSIYARNEEKRTTLGLHCDSWSWRLRHTLTSPSFLFRHFKLTIKGLSSGWTQAHAPLANPTDRLTLKKELAQQSYHRPDHEIIFEDNTQYSNKSRLH